MTEEVAPALAACLRAQPRLAALNLNDTSLTDAGVAEVCAALAGAAAAPQLADLELALNEVTPQGARAVAAALAGKRHLARLNLRENELESAGAAEIARALPGLPALRVLDLAGNQIGKGGALAVARALVAGGRTSFERLVLDENYLDDDTVEAVRALLASAFGSDACLSAEDLDPDAADDEDEADFSIGDVAMDGGEGDALADALAAGAKIS